MEHPEVRRLLLDAAASPRGREYVEAVLQGSGVSLGDMLSNGSLRLEDGRYWLNFGLLTRADQEIVVAAAATCSLLLVRLEGVIGKGGRLIDLSTSKRKHPFGTVVMRPL